MVLITPEVVRPIPQGQPTPDVTMPTPFIKNTSTTAPRTPGIDKTGPVPVKPPTDSLPYDRLAKPVQATPQVNPNPANAPVLLVPVPMGPQPAPPASNNGSSKQ
jgi:pilus assembly protein CpaC